MSACLPAMSGDCRGQERLGDGVKKRRDDRNGEGESEGEEADSEVARWEDV